MSKKSAICLAKNYAQADRIVSRLRSSGFAYNDISALFPDKQTTRDFAHEKNTKAPEGAATGAGTGGLVGGTLGLLAGIGALAIPGVGPLIAAGPIMAALSGAAVGAAVGGVAGALVGLGIQLFRKRDLGVAYIVVAGAIVGSLAAGFVLITPAPYGPRTGSCPVPGRRARR